MSSIGRGSVLRRLTLALTFALVLAGAKINADSGGFFACYGYCTIWYDCPGSVDWEYQFHEDGAACIRLVGCSGSDVTVNKDYPWLVFGTSVNNQVDLILYDQTIGPQTCDPFTIFGS